MSRLEYQLNPLLFCVIDSNENLLKLNRLALRSLSALISWFRLCLIISNGNHLNKSILELYLLSLIIVRSGKRIFDNRDTLTNQISASSVRKAHKAHKASKAHKACKARKVVGKISGFYVNEVVQFH